MMYDGYGWGWGVTMFMPLLWIVLVAVVIWAVVRLTDPDGRRSRVDHGPVSRESPQEILDRRFASGELDAQAYAEARERLAGRGPGLS